MEYTMVVMSKMVQNLIVYFQSSEALMNVLLILNALAAAVFTEIILTKKSQKVKYVVHRRSGAPKNEEGNTEGKINYFKVIIANLFVYVLYYVIVIIIVACIFQVMPHEERLWDLLQKTGKTYVSGIGISIVTTVASGCLLRSFGSRSNRTKTALIAAIFLLGISSGVLFFLNSFRLLQVTGYPIPVEAVISTINSRLNMYPLAISGEILDSIGDGKALRGELETGDDENRTDDNGNDLEPEEIVEPGNFDEYIRVLSKVDYITGLDYLEKAYREFQAGNWGNDYFNLGMMWHYIYNWWNEFKNVTGFDADRQECLENAISAYEECERMGNINSALYGNLIFLFYEEGEFEHVRSYINKILKLGENITSEIEKYKSYIVNWFASEPLESLMGDARQILEYENELSMYVLYGCCAVAENKNVDKAYEFLERADEYYLGKSAMVKILRCICGDLLGQDDSNLLYEIYALEDEYGLTEYEELYLARYLFATNRYNELLGYLASNEMNSEQMAMKACWYFKNRDTEYYSENEVRDLLQGIREKIESEANDTDKRNLLLLAQTLLQSCLGEVVISEMENYEMEGISDIEYALGAVNAFNSEKYVMACEYCENFFEAEKDKTKEDDESWKSLEAQEQMALHYYVQLIYAHSYYIRAMECRRGSEDRQVYMKRAEQECAAFKQSSKSLFYIGEHFDALWKRIQIENGNIEVDSDKADTVLY